MGRGLALVQLTVHVPSPGVVGVVLLIAGIMLVWLKRRGQPDQAAAEEPEPALGPAL